MMSNSTTTTRAGRPNNFSGSYNDLTNKPSIPASQVNSDWNAASGLPAILNKPTLFSGAYADLTGKPTLPNTPSQSLASRSLNSIFQVHATRDCMVNYSVQITVTASIGGAQNGDVILEIASNAAFNANVQTLAIFGAGQAVTLAVALNVVQPVTGTLYGFVPAGYYARLRTVNNTGTPSYLYRAGQEVLM
jgi:hypothetical protein